MTEIEFTRYLQSREGAAWTAADTVTVLDHLRQVERLARELIERVERKYPCADCGTLRSEAEGGRIFTVCDACWDKWTPTEREFRPRGTVERAERRQG